jgi:3'-5' exoribonuclease
VWEHAGEIADGFEQGDVVAVTGMAELYRGELQLRLERVRAVPPDEASPTDFLPRSQKDLAALERRLAEVVKSVGNPHLQALLTGFFREADFRDRFFAAPGAKSLHHAYIGGLAEHTSEVVELCLKVCEIFPRLDRDLLLTAAMLHDIGKLEELRWDTAFDYTDVGTLVGHIVLGEQRTREAMDRIEGFPEELKLRLSHILLSHHGTREYGSPVVPMTAEAIALHHAEDLDAKVNLFLTNISAAREQGRRWTERHFLLNRAFYVGPEEGAEAES